MKIIIFIIFILGLVYIVTPGPTKIEDLPAIPDSLKSDEPGDTYQNPNIAAYFSDYDRKKLTDFYREAFSKSYFGFLYPPISLNHPPELARKVIRNEQVSTFLEEYVYPLRGSIFVNGYEPFIDNNILKREHNFIGDHLHIKGRYFVSKVTLRFYPTDLFDRLIVYIGIWVSSFGLFEVSKKVLRNR